MRLQISPFPTRNVAGHLHRKTGSHLPLQHYLQCQHTHYIGIGIAVTISIIMKQSSVKKKKIKPSFNVPEGYYRAVLVEVANVLPHPWAEESDGKIRLLFNLPGVMDGVKPCRAGRNYERDVGDESPLNQVANVLLGRNLTAKELEESHYGFREAIGREVDLRIVHVKRRGYKVPYSNIQSIVPVGTWGEDDIVNINKIGIVQ